MNLIECLWHELKEFIQREVKPQTKKELEEGISSFWASLDVEKCRKYIGHFKKVLPAAIEGGGAATGF